MTTLTLESTAQVVRLSARPARVWIGHTSKGVPVQALVSAVVVEHTENHAELERELAEQPAIAFHGIALQAGLDELAMRQTWRALCLRCGLPPDQATAGDVARYVQDLQCIAAATIADHPVDYPLDVNQEAFARYAAECKEWQAIRDELVAGGEPPSAYHVTLEQQKRMLARGARPVTLEELAEPERPTPVLSDPLKDEEA